MDNKPNMDMSEGIKQHLLISQHLTPKGKMPVMTLTEEPAFPVNGATGWYQGMSLGDWFAGMAMQGILSNPNVRGADSDVIAEDAYEVAKSMLKARKGGSHE